jgi:FAD:protein FMN transferase
MRLYWQLVTRANVRFASISLPVLLAIAGVAQSAPAEQHLFAESRSAMGTVFTIYLYAGDQSHAEPIFEIAFEEIERVEQALSNYRPSSELSRINRLAGAGPVTTDPEVFHVLETSLEYARRSDGAFDITVGKLMRAWGFFRAQGRYPSPDELAAARANTGWRAVRLDRQARTVRFLTPGLEIDLGGIGKGRAVDRVVEILREKGITAALVDAGSSTIYALGAPPGLGGWKILVPQPGNRKRAISVVTLHDTSLSTSGSYEKFFRLGGRTYCHIMDPRTGAPVQGMLQTTVIAPLATDSDALSTAMFVLGPSKGKQLLSSVPGTSALWITGTDAEHSRQFAWEWPGVAAQDLSHNFGQPSPMPLQESR